MVRLLVVTWRGTVHNIVPALADTFRSIFRNDINDRLLLGDIVKHWLTILVEETHIDQKTVGLF